MSLTTQILAAATAVPELAGLDFPAVFARSEALTPNHPLSITPAERARHPVLLMCYLRARDLMVGDLTYDNVHCDVVDAVNDALVAGDSMTAMRALDVWCAENPTRPDALVSAAADTVVRAQYRYNEVPGASAAAAAAEELVAAKVAWEEAKAAFLSVEPCAKCGADYMDAAVVRFEDEDDPRSRCRWGSR